MRAVLATMTPKIERAIIAAFAHEAPNVLAYARQNAPWTDRTGNARNGLNVRVENSRSGVQMIVAHGVPYGIWLEVRWSGRYQIIRRTVDEMGPQVMATTRQMVAAELSS